MSTASVTPDQYATHWRALHEHGYFVKHPCYRDRLHTLGIERLRRYLQLSPSDTLLEVGCGYGRALYHLGPSVREVIGIDLSEGPIGDARDLLEGVCRATLHVGDGVTLAPIGDGVANKAYAFTVFQHLTRAGAARYMREMARVTKPDARVVVQFLSGGDPAIEVADRAEEQSLCYSREQIAALFAGAGLGIELIEREDVDVPAPMYWEWAVAVR